MEPPRTQYLDREGSALAYQVIGDGPVNVVAYFEIIQHLDLLWTDPDVHRNYERTAGFARQVHFQRRGFGLSEQVSYVPTLEQQADDILAVMDAVGMQRATLWGIFTACAPLALVAARAPDRVSGLVLLGPLAQGIASADELVGWPPEELAAVRRGVDAAVATWGSGASLEWWDPLQVTPSNTRNVAMLERTGATPLAAKAHFDYANSLDIRDLLRSVQVPTRVTYMPTGSIPEAAVRHVADLLPRGTFQALPPTKRGISFGRAYIPFFDVVEEVATGSAPSADAGRFLGTVLFTDVVSSTELLSDVGDASYRELRSDHERLVRLAVETGGGRLVKVLGDGTLSLFESPSKAVRCAERISREAEDVGLVVRCGIHTGEIEHDGIDITGLTVHIGARVQSTADPGEILVSRTVHDLTAGSGLEFTSRGDHDLKGIPGRWELFALVRVGLQADSLPAEASLETPIDKLAIQTARRAPQLLRAVSRMTSAVDRRRSRR